MQRIDLLQYIDNLLDITSFSDYCPNGLQVQGRDEINTIVSGVTASHALIEQAVDRNADMLLVHHGWFWKGSDPRIVGMQRRRMALLLAHDINLVAYHLPLDAHPQYGNNARLAELLGFQVTGGFAHSNGVAIGQHGRLPVAREAAELAAHIQAVLGREPLWVAGGAHPIRTLAWCSGGAQGYIDEAADLGVDAYISGEISEQTVHVARERGIHFFAAGHHATERYGVLALGRHIGDKFNINHEFVEIDNPA